MKDPLGDRMKSHYEQVTRYVLPRRTITVVRLDGRSFHTYTRGLTRPFDVDLHSDLVEATRLLCRDVQGCRLAYVQSDEVSLILTDYDTTTTEPWFGGVVQKIASVSAALLSSSFNHLRWVNERSGDQVGTFDARVFTIPQYTEVVNYLIWRQSDASRNSVSSLARHVLGHARTVNLTTDQLKALLLTENVDWHDTDARFRCGTMVYPELQVGDVKWIDPRTNEEQTATNVVRRVWLDDPAPNYVYWRYELRKLINTPRE
jgi:tRNA(His) guanylyltransferase